MTGIPPAAEAAVKAARSRRAALAGEAPLRTPERRVLGHRCSGLPDALRHLEEAGRLRPDLELEQAIAQLRAEQQ